MGTPQGRGFALLTVAVPATRSVSVSDWALKYLVKEHVSLETGTGLICLDLNLKFKVSILCRSCTL